MDVENKTYLDPNGYTPTFQVIFSFALGIFFSPFSYGLLYLIIFVLILEIIYAYFTNGDYCYQKTLLRVGIFFYALVGFIVGRSIICKDWDPLRGDYTTDKDIKKKRFEKHCKKCIKDKECEWCKK